MKKSTIIGLCLSLVLVTGSVYALSLGGAVGNVTKGHVSSSTVDNALNSAAIENLNSKLSSKLASCKCDTKTNKLTGCNFGDIRKVIKEHEMGVKTFLGRSFTIQSQVNQACWDQLQVEIPANNGYWSWYYSKYNGTDVSIKAVK